MEAYWKTQAQDAQSLAQALKAAGLAPARADGLESWATLANKKVTNQQAYT